MGDPVVSREVVRGPTEASKKREEWSRLSCGSVPKQRRQDVEDQRGDSFKNLVSF